jgi:uroporphyrin-III C-methyltransferase/precorrin-2 dehydrogenase/sirohydrochlorin ferrochelatase
VVFMGVGAADVIAARLIAAGRDPATPVAIVENGTRENEVRAFGALGNAADVIQAAGIQGPALLVIGEVVALAQREAGAAAMVRASRTTPTLSSLWEMLS